MVELEDKDAYVAVGQRLEEMGDILALMDALCWRGECVRC